jgi:hypothetical protein
MNQFEASNTFAFLAKQASELLNQDKLEKFEVIGELSSKTKKFYMRFYFGLKNEPCFRQAGSENECIFHIRKTAF